MRSLMVAAGYRISTRRRVVRFHGALLPPRPPGRPDSNGPPFLEQPAAFHQPFRLQCSLSTFDLAILSPAAAATWGPATAALRRPGPQQCPDRPPAAPTQRYPGPRRHRQHPDRRSRSDNRRRGPWTCGYHTIRDRRGHRLIPTCLTEIPETVSRAISSRDSRSSATARRSFNNPISRRSPVAFSRPPPHAGAALRSTNSSSIASLPPETAEATRPPQRPTQSVGCVVPSALSSLDGVTLGHCCRSGVRGSLGYGMSMCKLYPSDLTDEQWELVEPVITAWKARHPSVSGHQGKYAMREVGTGGPSARYLLCRSFSDDPQPERRMQLSLHVALQ